MAGDIPLNNLTAIPAQPFEAPAIRLSAAQSGAHILLSWSAGAGEFILQETSSLSSPMVWKAVNEAVTTNGNEQRISLNIPASARFYRLAKP